jgi:hypothetical protein
MRKKPLTRDQLVFGLRLLRACDRFISWIEESPKDWRPIDFWEHAVGPPLIWLLIELEITTEADLNALYDSVFVWDIPDAVANANVAAAAEIRWRFTYEEVEEAFIEKVSYLCAKNI